MKICQTVSDRPKIIEKFSQPADENGHVLLPGILPIASVFIIEFDVKLKVKIAFNLVIE